MNEEIDAIRQAALDYMEGWYEGNPDRMERSLHSDLAKRSVVSLPKTGREVLDHLSADMMIEYTRGGGGKEKISGKPQIDVRILDMAQSIASLKVTSPHYTDYLQIAKLNGEWKIVNVLWNRRPKPDSEPP